MLKKILLQFEVSKMSKNYFPDKICCTEDLKCLFILLLRQFDPTIQSKQYLQDIIITNHLLLLFLENSNNTPSVLPPGFHRTSMSDHISQ